MQLQVITMARKIHLRKSSDEIRFWIQVANVGASTDDCWMWRGYANAKGYGCFGANGIRYFAHRFSYYLAFGEDPGDLLVCHKCDNPSCVNPKHLFLGTHKDNLEDMREKGRSCNGERNSRAILSLDDVMEICRRASLGETHASIAQDFPVKRSGVSDILTGKKWSWATAIKYEPRGTRKGSEVRNSKLTDDSVREICGLLAKGIKRPLIASQYNVSSATIDYIASGDTWKHIPREDNRHLLPRCGGKLNKYQVLEIKRRISLGEQNRAIAKDYGVQPEQIRRIRAGERWANL